MTWHILKHIEFCSSKYMCTAARSSRSIFRSQGGAPIPSHSCPYRKRKGHHSFFSTCAQRKSQVRTQGEVGRLQAKDRSFRNPLKAPWSWTCRPRNYEEIHFCCLGLGACGVLFWLPWPTGTYAHSTFCSSLFSSTRAWVALPFGCCN